MDQKAAAGAALLQTGRLIGLDFNPQPVVFYKPQKSGNGVAMRVDLRLEPEFAVSEKGTQYIVKNKQQGLFVEIAAQSGSDANGNATFDWQGVVRTKLGLPDISKLLVSIRRWRQSGLEVPVAFQAKGKDGPKSDTVGSFHKWESGSTTLTYTFGDETSQFGVSKQAVKGGDVVRRSIQLDLAEELIFEATLQLALAGFIRTGLR